MELTLCYIRESYFLDHPDYQKMPDPGNTSKQSKRTHLCVRVTIDNNCYYIPLRNKAYGHSSKALQECPYALF